jgi:ribosome maturation factor RimP
LQTEKDFNKFRGANVVVHTYVPFEGQKKIKGALGIADDEVIEIFCDEEKIIRVPREKVSQVRLAWEEEEGRSKK